MGELSKLKGLGRKSERCLNEIGIKTREDLERIGAIKAFVMLEEQCSIKPSLNFLYAIMGAVEDRHWVDIAKSEKGRLLIELEAYRECEAIRRLELKTR